MKTKKKNLKRLKVGALGWDMGDAVRVLFIRNTPHGKIILCKVVQVYTSKSGLLKRKKGWLEAFTEKRLRACLGPDVNGDLPPDSIFRERGQDA
jgi:hypothetical protein